MGPSIASLTPSTKLRDWVAAIHRGKENGSTEVGRESEEEVRPPCRDGARAKEAEVVPRALGEQFDEVAEGAAVGADGVGDTASLVSARRRLSGKVPLADDYRGGEEPGRPREDEDLEVHRKRVKDYMKPGFVTRCTPMTNGEILCILPKPMKGSKPKKVRRNHYNTFACPEPDCGYEYKGFYWMSRRSHHIKCCHPEKRETGLGAKSLVAEFKVDELTLPDREEPWWRCPFCPMGLAKPPGYEPGIPSGPGLHNRLWTAKRQHWARVHPEKKWVEFKVDGGKGAKGRATWAMRETLQARAAATASNMTMETIRNSGGHSLTVIRMPDERTKPIISRDDGTHDMLLCGVCGKRGLLTTLRVFPCGDTITARLRSVNLRKRDVEKVETPLEKVRAIPG